MYCVRCRRDLKVCVCPDREDRLKAIEESGQWLLIWATQIQENLEEYKRQKRDGRN